MNPDFSRVVPGARQLVQRYGLALHVGLGLGMAVALATGLWGMRSGHEHQDAALADLALSGRQEMLIQRIARGATRLAQAPAPGAESHLSQAVADFDLGLRHLSGRAGEVPQLTHVYFESGTVSLQPLSRRYLDLARAVLEDPARVPPSVLKEIAGLATTELAAQQAEASVALAEYAGHVSKVTGQRQVLLLALAAVLMTLEAALVIWPLRRRLAIARRQKTRDDAEIATLGDALGRARAKANQLTDRLVEVGWSDELTGLMNRGHFHIWLEAQASGGDDGSGSLGVIALSLDNFRALNECLGHAAGDMLLRLAAERLRDTAPDGAALARTDGNGFAMAMHIADEIVLRETAERLRINLVKTVQVAGREVPLSVSIGTALRTGIEPVERLLGDAEIALGRLRRNAPGGVLSFTPRMRTDMLERTSLIEDLRGAVAETAFEAHFQPQIRLGRGGLLGFEVLARWPHPIHGLLAPARFLEAAEAAGLHGALDRIVLDQALGALVRLREKGLAIPRISVNASAQSLLDTDYAGALRDTVGGAGLAPADLVVEIAEARIRELGLDRAQDAMNRLGWAGFETEVDGFGTGLAALSTLSRLPVSGVKLDRALVASLPDTGAESVVRALTGLGRDLGLAVIAEGVQSSTSLGFLAESGVAAVQGFGISRPLSEADVEAWMGAGGAQGSAA